MATMSITINDAIAPDVIDSLCRYGGYPGPNDINGNPPNPLPNKAAFAKNVVTNFMKTVYRHDQAGTEAEAARQATYDAVDPGLGGIA
jgi:hypothetical protein